MKFSGGEIVMKSLIAESVPYILGIPGHGCLGLFDAIRRAEAASDIKYIQVKHEQTSAHIADAYYRISGRPLAVFASIGPGSLNTAIGIATSYVDSTAMIMLSGDTHVHMKGVGVLQEIERYQDSNFIRAMEPIAKRTWRVESVTQLPRTMRRAFSQALSGRPGPVVLALPMDVQSATFESEASFPAAGSTPAFPAPERTLLKDAVHLMKEAKRPVILLGGGALRARAAEELVALAEKWGAAVITTMAGKSAFPEDHPLYCFHTGSKGTPIGLHISRSADVVLALGTRFADETTCSYRKGTAFSFPDTKLIHIDIDPVEIGKNYPCDLGIVADLKQSINTLLELIEEGIDFPNRQEYHQEITEQQNLWQQYLSSIRASTYDKITISQLIGTLNQCLPAETIIATSSGNTQAQLFQEYCFKKPYKHLTTGGFSTMGWAVPAAIGAHLAEPQTPVVALLGDGDFMMIMQELSTIAQYNFPVVILLANNNGWMAIADLQSDVLGVDKVFGTLWERDGQSYTPDFVQIAKSFGLEGLKVTDLDQLAPTISQALAGNAPVLIEIEVTDHYPESGGKAFGWWDVPIPEYIEDKIEPYRQGRKEESI